MPRRSMLPDRGDGSCFPAREALSFWSSVPVRLRNRAAWVFDMDGTLTEAMHDFEGLRRELELPVGQPILESLARLPPEEAAPLRMRLDELELELAGQARVAAGTQELLDQILENGLPLGILTRNNRRNVEVTLAAAGLGGYFGAQDIVTRDEATPKPSPHGLEILFARWEVRPSDCVMVGDYLFDLEAGRASGCLSVYIDVTRAFPYRAAADLVFESLAEVYGVLCTARG